MFSKLMGVLAVLVVLCFCQAGYATVVVTDIKAGDGDQTADLATELTKCTGGAAVTIVGGKLAIAAGGNAYAGLLRDMINSATTVTLEVGNDVPGVFVGAWDPPLTKAADATDATKKSTGKQKLDMKDIKDIAAKFAWASPWGAMIHEITEVFEATKDSLLYRDAHSRGIDNENIAYALEGKGERPQDFVTIPKRAPAGTTGGWLVYQPFIDVVQGPGWIVADLIGVEPVDGPLGITPLQWGYLGQFTLPEEDLYFPEGNILLRDAWFQPIPEPATLALLAFGGLMLARRCRQAPLERRVQ